MELYGPRPTKGDPDTSSGISATSPLFAATANLWKCHFDRVFMRGVPLGSPPRTQGRHRSH